MQKLPPLVEIRAFDAAARHLSFKKAAAELGVTPTAISHQIRLLERYCGRTLFRRRPRPLSLTDAGVRLFPAIRSGLEAFAIAIAAVFRLAKAYATSVAGRAPASWEEGHCLDLTGVDAGRAGQSTDGDDDGDHGHAKTRDDMGIVACVSSPRLSVGQVTVTFMGQRRHGVLLRSSAGDPPSWQRFG